MPLLGRAIFWSALLSAGPACGLWSRDSHPGPAAPHTKVAVEVDNHNWNDVTIYLMTGGLPQRLGMVTAMTSGRFGFPAQRLHSAGSVRLRALPVAGQPHTSEAILVQPGQAITWTLENDLDRSSFTVY